MKWLACVLVVAIAACGGGGPAKTPTETVQDAIGATIAAKSLAENATVSSPGSALGPKSGSGGYSFPNDDGYFFIKVPPVLAREPAVLSQSTVEVLIPPPFNAKLPTGKEYQSVDLAHPLRLFAFGDITELAALLDAGRFLEAIQEGLVSATKGATRGIDGVVATEYTVDVDLARTTSALGQSERDLLHGGTMTDTIWVGPGERIVQITATPSAPGGDVYTVVYSAFGTPAVVVLPTATAVTPATG